MNERIKEFSEQAWKHAQEHAGDFLKESALEAYDRKFAELIIRKCADVADKADENKCEWIGGNILTYFGVKE